MLRNVARAYRDCGYTLEAVRLFKEAILLQEDNWMALSGLAKCCKYFSLQIHIARKNTLKAWHESRNYFESF